MVSPILGQQFYSMNDAFTQRNHSSLDHKSALNKFVKFYALLTHREYPEVIVENRDPTETRNKISIQGDTEQ